MPDFTINHDGQDYHVDAPDQESAVAAFKKMQGLVPDPRAAYGATATEHETKIPPSQSTTWRSALASALEGVPIAGPKLAPLAGATPQQREEFRHYFPAQDFAAGTAGGVAAAGAATLAPEAVAPLLGTSRALGVVGNAVGGGVGGGVIGGTDAYMRGQNPATGAMIGGGAGFAAPIVGAGAGQAYRAASEYLRPNPVPGVGWRGRDMLTRGVGDATPQGIAQARQDMGPNTFAGELTPDLFNLSRSIGGGADQAGTDVRNAYNARFAGQRGRLENAVTQNLGARANVPQTLEQVLNDRSTTARPLYQAAEARPVAILGADRRLQQLMGDRDIQAGIARGAEDSQREALAQGVPYQPGPWRMLFNAKTGLDNMVEDERNDITGRLSSRGRGIAMLRDAFRDHLDRLNPDYAAARQSWEGPTRVHQAVREGQRALGRSFDANEMAEQIGDYNAAGQDGYRIGMRNSVALLMDGARGGDTQARNLLMSPAAHAKISSAFGQNAADAVRNSAEQEFNIMQRTQQVVPNWATGASNVNRQEVAAIANPPGRFSEYARQFDLAKPQTYLGVNPDPRAHVGGWNEASNERARQQLAPVLTSPADDPLVRALLAARNRSGSIENQSGIVNRIMTRLTGVAGGQQGRKYGDSDTVH